MPQPSWCGDARDGARPEKLRTPSNAAETVFLAGASASDFSVYRIQAPAAEDRSFEWHPHKSRPTLPRPGIRAENASPPLAELFRDSGGSLARDTRRILSWAPEQDTGGTATSARDCREESGAGMASKRRGLCLEAMSREREDSLAKRA